MDIGYAFIDNGGVLHVVSVRVDAERCSANGRIIETEIERKGGYPAVDGKQIVVYGERECYTDDNRNGGVPQNTASRYPGLAALYGELSD